MNEIENGVVVVMIEIFGKSLNYRENSGKKFIYGLLFTSLSNFKWA